MLLDLMVNFKLSINFECFLHSDKKCVVVSILLHMSHNGSVSLPIFARYAFRLFEHRRILFPMISNCLFENEIKWVVRKCLGLLIWQYSEFSFFKIQSFYQKSL